MTAPSGYALVWSDEFAGASLSPEWTASTTAATIGTYRAANAVVTSGMVRLRVDSNFDSARIGTQTFRISHGYVEFRARAQAQQGSWCSLFLLSGNVLTYSPYAGPQEIDVELLGRDPNNAYLTSHWQTTPSALSDSSTVSAAWSDGQWHTFGVEWGPNSIKWYIDGSVAKTQVTNIPNAPLMIVMENRLGGWAGDPDGTTTYPIYADVDYVRVYQTWPWRGYQRVTMGGALNAQQQADFIAAIKQVGHSQHAAAQLDTHVRQITAQDYIVELSMLEPMTQAQWADAIYKQLKAGAYTDDITDKAAISANLTVTTYAGADWDARRVACKTALGI